SHVEDCVPRFRGWEWYFLNSAADASIELVSGFAVSIAGDGRSLVESFDGGFRWRSTLQPGRGSVLESSSELKQQRISDWQQSHEGSTAAAAAGFVVASRIVAWDCASGRVVREVELDDSAPLDSLGRRDLLFHGWRLSPDGERLAVRAPSGVIRVLHLRDPSKDRELEGHASDDLSFAWSPGATRLLSWSEGFGGSVRLWDVDRSTCTTIIPAAGIVGVSANFSADGTQFLVMASGPLPSVRVFDTVSGDHKGELSLPADQIGGGAWFAGPSESIVVAMRRPLTLSLWDVTTASRRIEYEGIRSALSTTSLAGGGQVFLAASEDLSIRAWDLRSASPRAEYVGCWDRVRSTVGIEGTRMFATVDLTGEARLWHLSTRSQTGVLRVLARAKTAVFTGQGDTVRCSDLAGRVNNLDVNTGEFIERGKSLWVGGTSDCALDQSGDWLLQRAGNRLVVWNADAAVERASIEWPQGGSFVGWSVSAGGQRVLAINLQGVARIWDGESGRLVAEIRDDSVAFTRRARILNAVFAEGARSLITYSDSGCLSSWDIATGGLQRRVELKAVDQLEGESFGYRGRLAVDDHGTAAIAYERSFCLVDMAGEREVRWVPSVGNRITGLAFCPLDRRLATSHFDGVIRLWDTATGSLVLELPGDGKPIKDVQFSTDGTRILSLTNSGLIAIFDSIPYRIRFAERQLRERGDQTNLGILYLKELRGESPPTWLSDRSLSEHRPDFMK
ncbi:MAG: WD40 repeat domain-containing protein, partial [Phycisphaerales bacterium]